MNYVPAGVMSKAFFLLTVAGLLMAGGWANGDTHDLKLNRIQLFGDCSEYEPSRLMFSPAPVSMDYRGVGYDTRAGGPRPVGTMILESENYYLLQSMDFFFGYETDESVFEDQIDTQGYLDNGAWYDMHSWRSDERYDISLLRHDPPGIDTERALIFAMPLNEDCIVQLDWRYPTE